MAIICSSFNALSTDTGCIKWSLLSMRTVQSRSFCNYSSVSYFYNHGFIDHKFIVRLQTRNHQVITTCWPARQKDDSHHGVNLSMHGCSYNKFDKPQIVKQCIETEKCFQQKFTNSVDTMLPITLGTSNLQHMQRTFHAHSQASLVTMGLFIDELCARARKEIWQDLVITRQMF